MLKVKLNTQSPEAIETAALVTWAFQAPPAPPNAAGGGADVDRMSDESPASPPEEPRLDSGLEVLDHRSGGRLSELTASG